MNPLSSPLFFKANKIPLMLTLTLILLAVPVSAQTLTITTDKDSYNPGDKMTVSGSGATPNTAVTISVYNPNGLLAAAAQTTSDADGNYLEEVLTFPSEPTTLFPYGDFTVKAYCLGDTAEITTSFSAVGVAPPTVVGPITISIDAGPTYLAGETADWVVLFAINGLQAEPSIVSFKLYPPGAVNPVTPTYEKIVDGLYKVSYTIPEAATGFHALVVSAEHGAYKSAAVKGFKVDTETPSILAQFTTTNRKIDSLDFYVKSTLSRINDDIDSLSDTVSAGLSALQSTINGQTEYVGESVEYLGGLITASSGDVKASVSTGLKAVTDSVSDTNKYVGESVKYLSGVVDASAKTVQGTVISGHNDLMALIVKSSADIAPFLIAIAVLVIIAIVLAAIAAIRTLRE